MATGERARRGTLLLWRAVDGGGDVPRVLLTSRNGLDAFELQFETLKDIRELVAALQSVLATRRQPKGQEVVSRAQVEALHVAAVVHQQAASSDHWLGYQRACEDVLAGRTEPS